MKWNAILGRGGWESACGWCTDRLGFVLANYFTVLTDAPGDGPAPNAHSRR
jgi:predicted 3-demethylubiquinone-9 3-methyltransferase (glyoxalase superfamily)